MPPPARNFISFNRHKIMRFILRKIAENQTDQIGDVSTLADPPVVEALVKGKQ